MKKLCIVLLLVIAMVMPGCFSSGPDNQDAAMTVGEILTQSAGVLAFAANLPPAPVDKNTQEQLAGVQAWAAYLAPLAAGIGEIATSAALRAAAGGGV